MKKKSDPVAELERVIRVAGGDEEYSKQQEFYEYLHDEIVNYERKVSNCYEDLNRSEPRSPGTKDIIINLALEYSVKADAFRDVRTKFLEMFHMGAEGWRDKSDDCMSCVICNTTKIED